MYQRWVKTLCYLDLTTDGHASFSKLVLATILITCIIQQNLNLGIVIALLSASFGKSTFVAFLKRSEIRASDAHVKQEISEKITQEIIDRRNTDRGFEPA
jgi:hypothetical protein